MQTVTWKISFDFHPYLDHRVGLGGLLGPFPTSLFYDSMMQDHQLPPLTPNPKSKYIAIKANQGVGVEVTFLIICSIKSLLTKSSCLSQLLPLDDIPNLLPEVATSLCLMVGPVLLMREINQDPRQPELFPEQGPGTFGRYKAFVRIDLTSTLSPSIDMKWNYPWLQEYKGPKKILCAHKNAGIGQW